MNGMNRFERTIKDSLESYEVPYNSADWAQLQRSLLQKNGSGRVVRSGLYALLFGGSLAAVSSFVMLMAPEPMLSGMGAPTKALFPQEQVIAEVPTTENSGTSAVETVNFANTQSEVSPISSGSTVSTREVKTSSSTPASTASLPDARTNAGSIVPAPNNMPIVHASISEGCPGTLVEFAVQNIPEEGIYLWNFGDGSFSNKPAPSHAFSKPGSFEVMLSHSTPGGGSIHNKPAADKILIHEAPEATFNLLKQEYDNTVPSVHFENRSIRGQSYTWDFGDGSTSNVAHPDHVYKKAGVYHVALTVTNPKGCVDRTEKTVRIDSDYNLLAPKTFSPNSDGVEDTFIPEALKSLGVKFHFSVFDSNSGVLVYDTTDPERPWNGKVTNKGDQCASGDYVWMVEMKDGDKLGGTYNGTVDLVR